MCSAIESERSLSRQLHRQRLLSVDFVDLLLDMWPSFIIQHCNRLTGFSADTAVMFYQLSQITIRPSDRCRKALSFTLALSFSFLLFYQSITVREVEWNRWTELHQIRSGHKPIIGSLGVQISLDTLLVLKRGRHTGDCGRKSRSNFGFFSPRNIVLKFHRRYSGVRCIGGRLSSCNASQLPPFLVVIKMY